MACYCFIVCGLKQTHKSWDPGSVFTEPLVLKHRKRLCFVVLPFSLYTILRSSKNYWLPVLGPLHSWGVDIVGLSGWPTILKDRTFQTLMSNSWCKICRSSGWSKTLQRSALNRHTAWNSCACSWMKTRPSSSPLWKDQVSAIKHVYLYPGITPLCWDLL